MSETNLDENAMKAARISGKSSGAYSVQPEDLAPREPVVVQESQHQKVTQPSMTARGR